MKLGKKLITLLKVGDYTFSKSGPTWGKGTRKYICSRQNKGCKAYAHVSNDKFILKIYTDHNHEATNFAKLEDGTYIKLC